MLYKNLYFTIQLCSGYKFILKLPNSSNFEELVCLLARMGVQDRMILVLLERCCYWQSRKILMSFKVWEKGKEKR